MRRALAAACLWAAASATAASATAASAQPAAAAPPRYTVSVLTFGQGNVVYERFGHNALRIRDALTGSDLAYNWGMFDFAQPNFLGRFLSGDTQYWVQAFPAPWLIDHYAGEDRETVEQVLALTPEQAAALARAVERNALDEFKYYRYEYFRDNCSTRVRDALDTVLGGALRTQFSVGRTPWTYRSESVRLTAADGLAQAGIDLALGPRADEALTPWDAMFIPMRLRDYLRQVTVPSASGGTTPLVVSDSVLYRARRPAELAERRGLSIGAWGPILGAWMVLLIPLSAASRSRLRVPAAVMAALWYGGTGLIGLVLLGMWLGSAHEFWYANLNLLLVSPLGLVAAWPATRAILRGRADRLSTVLVGVVATLALLGLAVGLLGVQVMGGPLLLLLPAHLGLALAYWRRTR